jgi:transposase
MGFSGGFGRARPWAGIPERYGPHTACVNRFNRWRKAGVWDRLLEAVSKAYDDGIQMIDSSSIRVHQHAANPSAGYSAKLRLSMPRACRLL